MALKDRRLFHTIGSALYGADHWYSLVPIKTKVGKGQHERLSLNPTKWDEWEAAVNRVIAAIAKEEAAIKQELATPDTTPKKENV